MKTLKEFIAEAKCCNGKKKTRELLCSKNKKNRKVRESASISFDMTYPWYEGGEDKNWEDYEDYHKIKDTAGVLELLTEFADEYTYSDGAAYIVTVTIDGVKIVGYLPEDTLFVNQEGYDINRIERLLSSNKDAIWKEVKDFAQDMGFIYEEE